jgi:hypothetical protein
MLGVLVTFEERSDEAISGDLDAEGFYGKFALDRHAFARDDGFVRREGCECGL